MGMLTQAETMRDYIKEIRNDRSLLRDQCTRMEKRLRDREVKMPNWRHEYTVTGRGSFPVDMLRYEVPDWFLARVQRERRVRSQAPAHPGLPDQPRWRVHRTGARARTDTHQPHGVR